MSGIRRMPITVLLFFLSAIPLLSANISLPSLSGKPATTIDFPVNIDDAKDVGGFNFNITFDPDVLHPVGVSAGSLTAGWMLTPNITVPGQITVAGLDTSLQGLTGGSGSLVILKFNVTGSVGSSTGLNFEGNNKIDDVTAQTLPSEFYNGSFGVTGYSISGNVNLQGGEGLVTDAVLSLTGAMTASVSPDAQGDYSFTGLPPGSYTVTPALANYAFNPENRSYPDISSDIAGADFLGTWLEQTVTLAVSSQYGSPSPPVGTHFYYAGSSVTASVESPVSGPAGTRYICTGWTGTGSVLETGSATATTFNITQNSSISWQWTTQYLLTVQVQPQGAGLVAMEPPGQAGWHDAGTQVALTPESLPGYFFSHWEGDVDPGKTTDSPLTAAMDAKKTLTAVFVAETQELTVNPLSVSFDFHVSDPSAPLRKNTEISISNTGDTGTLNWTAGDIDYHRGSGWITLAPASGSLQPGAGQDVVLEVDRADMSYGTYTATVPVLSNGGNREISVTVNITADERIVSIPDTSFLPGQAIQIPVNIDNAEDVAGFGFELTYDPAVLQVSEVLAGSLTGGWTVMANTTIAGKVIVNAFNPALQPLPAVSGSLLLLNFTLSGSLGDTCHLDFSQATLTSSDPGATPIPCVTAAGVFTALGYAISGQVVLQGGPSPVTDTLLTLSGGADRTVSPDAQGNYSFTNLLPGNYSVSPALAGYIFAPLSRAYPGLGQHHVSQDYTGTYRCSLTVSSAHGSPVPSVGQHIYDHNTPVNASVSSPVAGGAGTRYVCAGWEGTGSVPETGGATSTAFTIKAHSSITWQWNTQYRLTAGTQGSGSILMSPQGSDGWFDAGTVVNLTAQPAGGWAFSHWSGDIAGTGSVKPVTVNAAKNITAHFIRQYELTVSSAYGTPSPTVGKHYYNEGAAINASVGSPVAGGTGRRFFCTGWAGAGSVPETGTTTSLTFAINANSTLQWTWKIQYLLTANVAGGGSVSRSPALQDGWYDNGTVVSLTAVPDNGWVFSHWTGDLTGTSVTGSVTMNAARAVTAHFIKLHELTVSSAHGSPVPAVGVHQYKDGVSVTASVTSPVAGPAGTRYISTGWTGTGSVPDSGGGTTTTFTMTQPSSIQWNWKTQHRLIINVSGAGLVTVLPVVSNNWYDEGTTVTLTATPSSGWEFSHWSGSVSATTNVITFAMDGFKSLTAHFVRGFSLHPEQPLIDINLQGNAPQNILTAVMIQYVGSFNETVNMTGTVQPATGSISVDIIPNKAVPPGDDVCLLDITLSGATAPETYLLTVQGKSSSYTETAEIRIAANAMLSIPRAISPPSDVFARIPLNITNAGGIRAFNIEFLYDPQLLDMASQGAGVVPGALTPAGWTFQPVVVEPGVLSIAGSGPTALAPEAGSIAVIKAYKKTGAVFPKEGTPTTIGHAAISGAQGKPLPCKAAGGNSLFVLKQGDINNDGIINIMDVILCLRMAIEMDVEVGGTLYSPVYPEWLRLRADMNGDGDVNISDVILVMRKSIGVD